MRFQKESTVIELIDTNTELPVGQELIVTTTASDQPLCMLGTMPSSCRAPLHSTLPTAPERGAIVISILMMKDRGREVIDLQKGAWAYEAG